MSRKTVEHLAGAVIREELLDDCAGVRAVHEEAFGRDAEAMLVERLREERLIISAVVAEMEGEIIGSAIFSRISVRSPSAQVDAAALAPVAVAPHLQRQGVGTRMIEYGLRKCARRGSTAVFVLGDPAYYARFGFSSSLGRRVSSPYSKAGEAWMALEINPEVLPPAGAHATYPAAFSIVE